MIQEGMDDWVGEVQAKLNKEINSVHLSTIKSIEGIKSQPQTVCLVYMVEQHDGGQASYCEVYDKEETAVKSLLSRGFKCRGGSFPEEYTLDELCWARVAANVEVKTDDT